MSGVVFDTSVSAAELFCLLHFRSLFYDRQQMTTWKDLSFRCIEIFEHLLIDRLQPPG